MRIHSGTLALPFCLILAGTLAASGAVDAASLIRLWPTILIALGMEKLYLWTSR